MKVLILLSVTCALAWAASPSNEAAWHKFKLTYSKKYTSPEEEQYRQGLFFKNQQKVEEHNAKYKQGQVSYGVKINQFADMTTDEVVQKMNGYKSSPNRKPQFYFQKEGVEAAATVDWRSKGAVTPVKNQAQCGSCWAFSTTGSLEGQHFLKTKKLVSLSEQQLVDCSGAYGNMGCNGGLMDQAFEYIKANGGIDTEESYPYTSRDGNCKFNKKTVGATCTGYVDIPAGDEDALKKAVSSVGPVSVAIDASNWSFQMYSEGVYDEPSCSSSMLDHGVLAVGYGSENGQDYWLVKNSWDTVWGEQGYIKMTRNRSNQCGIASQASYPLV